MHCNCSFQGKGVTSWWWLSYCLFSGRREQKSLWGLCYYCVTRAKTELHCGGFDVIGSQAYKDFYAIFRSQIKRELCYDYFDVICSQVKKSTPPDKDPDVICCSQAQRGLWHDDILMDLCSFFFSWLTMSMGFPAWAILCSTSGHWTVTFSTHTQICNDLMNLLFRWSKFDVVSACFQFEKVTYLQLAVQFPALRHHRYGYLGPFCC